MLLRVLLMLAKVFSCFFLNLFLFSIQIQAELFEVEGPGASDFVGKPWSRLIGGFAGCEGAQWVKMEEGIVLLFAAHHDHLVFRWSEGTGLNLFKSGSPEATSFRQDKDGNLIVVEQATRRLSKWNTQGETIEVLADKYQERRLNRPNDARMDEAGRVWFTDPDYLFKKRPHETKEQAGQYVYCYDPSTGTLEAKIKTLKSPNGIAISPDGQHLFVGESRGGLIFKYNLSKDGSLGEGKLFYKNPERRLDGLSFDQKGQLWLCSKTSLVALNEKAEVVGKVELPGMPTSTDFGPEGWVCVTLRDSAYVVKL